MISESQERMVAVVEPERLADVAAVCERWELPCTVIGEVTDDGELRAFIGRRVGRRDPGRAAHRRVPALRARAARRARRRRPRSTRSTTSRRRGSSSSTTSSSARAPSAGPGSTPPCCASTGTRGIAVSLDGPPLGERDPFAAGYGAALDVGAQRRLRRRRAARASPTASTSAAPRSPRSPGSSSRRSRASRARRDELGIPVVSGNVSLYNETGGRPIPPTPVVGCVGLVRDVTQVPGRWRAGDTVYLLHGGGAELVALRLAERAALRARARRLRRRARARPPRGRRLVGATAACAELAQGGRGVIVAATDRPDWRDVVELGVV